MQNAWNTLIFSDTDSLYSCSFTLPKNTFRSISDLDYLNTKLFLLLMNPISSYRSWCTVPSIFKLLSVVRLSLWVDNLLSENN